MWTELLEELTLNAWPTLQTVHYDGWALRFAEGFTRRSNSVNVLYESRLGLAEKVDYCEAMYLARGLRTVFKITGVQSPPPTPPSHGDFLRSHAWGGEKHIFEKLDAFLAARGYAREATTSVQVVELKSSPPNPLSPTGTSVGRNQWRGGAEARFETKLTEAWLEVFCRLNAERAEYRHVLTRVLENIVPALCYMTLKQDGEAVAVGMGVLERGYLCLMGIATDERLRRQGLGTHMMLSLMDWGKNNGAHHAYLQVMTNNIPALNLYDKLGFREVYQYWYRVSGG